MYVKKTYGTGFNIFYKVLKYFKDLFKKEKDNKPFETTHDR